MGILYIHTLIPIINKQNMKFTQDNFAKFIFSQGLKIKNYNYDLFYDIVQIQKDRQYNSNIHSQPIYRKYYLFIRELGSHLIYEDEKDLFDTLFINNDKVFEITFCFNYTYFRNEYFANIKKLK